MIIHKTAMIGYIAFNPLFTLIVHFLLYIDFRTAY